MISCCRRTFLKAAGLLPGFACFSKPIFSAPVQAGVPPLKVAAAGANLLYGSPLFPQDLQRPDVLQLYATQCSLVVSTFYMKKVQAQPDQFDFSTADAVRDFATSHSMKLRGHPLIYGNATPDWVNSLSAKEARAVLEKHVRTIVGRYRGQMHSWDVVNEAIDQTSGGAFRGTPWFNLIGPDYIEHAFRAASEADPQALLCYNEFGIEADGLKQEMKREAVLRLLERLKSRNVPVGALGVQSHIGPKFHGTKIVGFLQKIREMGLKIIISELDVRDELPDGLAERDAGIARAYETYLTTVLGNPAVEAVITWGLYDGDSWLRKDKSRQGEAAVRPLPFDDNLALKPIARALISAFSRRNAAAQSLR